MATHKMGLKQPYFNLIKCGKKTIELRLYDSSRRLINPDDKIIFQNGNIHIIVRVKGIIRAGNFDSLFDIIDVRKTGLEEKDKAIRIMEQFYDKGAQRKFGVVAILIEKI